MVQGEMCGCCTKKGKRANKRARLTETGLRRSSEMACASGDRDIAALSFRSTGTSRLEPQKVGLPASVFLPNNCRSPDSIRPKLQWHPARKG